MDIVVLFDMGRSGLGDLGETYRSFAHFEETRDYITGAFLKEFLRKGDTFHLISFGDTPRIELSRRIEGEGDYRTIIGRLLLLYPLAQSSSLENAAAYAQAFVAELPPARQKKVVFFTAQGGVTATELGMRFNSENTNTYLAAIPASFGTLVSGRGMMKVPPKITPPVITAGPPLIAPPVITVYPPVLPSLPAFNTNEFTEPMPPLVLIPPVSGSIERTAPAPLSNVEPPVIKMLHGNPPDITAAPANPEFRLIWDGRDEPVLFDKIEVLVTILPLAGMILLFALALGCAVTWKRKSRADTYTIEDYLCQMNENNAPENSEEAVRYDLPTRGLLQKADEAREQLA
jgi:hypothetical protein